MEAIPLTVGGVVRRYLLSRPENSPGPWPLVLMLHGTGGSAAFAADETGWAELAAERRFAVAFPDGLAVDPTQPSRFLTNPQRWNDGSTKPGDSFHSEVDDVAFLTAVLDDVVRRGVADPTRTYLTGFSNGASMAFRYAAEQGQRLAAVATISGYCHVSTPPVNRPVPTLFAVGDSDLLIPLQGGPVRLPWGNRVVTRSPVTDGLTRWAGMLGCEPTPQVVSDANGILEQVYPGSVEFRSVIVSGSGHHWPAGKGQFNPRLAGPPSDRWPANQRIWAFFERHTS